MEITAHTVEKIIDPFQILSGDRYEFFLSIEVNEDDELYRENGLKVKVLFIVDDQSERISHYYIMEADTENVLDFELEDDELELIKQYCKEHYREAD